METNECSITFEYPCKVIITGEHLIVYGGTMLSSCIKNKKMKTKIIFTKLLKNIENVECSQDKQQSLIFEIKDTSDNSLNTVKIGINFDEIPTNDVFSKVLSILDSTENDDLITISNNQLNNLAKNSSLKYFLDKILFLIVSNLDFLTLLRNTIIEYSLELSVSNIIDIDIDSDLERKSLVHLKLLLSFMISFLLKVSGIKNTHFNSKFKQYLDNMFIKVFIETNINKGYGLGSSAAYSCTISETIYNIFNNFIFENIDLEENKEFSKLIYEQSKFNLILLLSFISETFFHHKTTGGDVVTILSKKTILFKNILTYKEITLNEDFDKTISLYLIFLGKSRLSKNLINKVSDKRIVINKTNKNSSDETVNVGKDNSINLHKDNHNSILSDDNYFKDMVLISNQIIEILTNEINIDINQINTKSKFNKIELLELISKNQACLKEIGVSEENIDNCISTLNDFPTKISGAGGGGILISFVDKLKEDTFISLCSKNQYKYEKLEFINI